MSRVIENKDGTLEWYEGVEDSRDRIWEVWYNDIGVRLTSEEYHELKEMAMDRPFLALIKFKQHARRELKGAR